MLKVLGLLIFLPMLALIVIGGGLLALPFAIAQGVFGLFGGALGMVFGLGLAIAIVALVGSVLGATALFVLPVVLIALLVAFAVAVIPVALPLLLIVGFIWLVARAAQSKPAATPVLPAPGVAATSRRDFRWS